MPGLAKGRRSVFDGVEMWSTPLEKTPFRGYFSNRNDFLAVSTCKTAGHRRPLFFNVVWDT
jgi:hypothetical protein